MKRFLAATLVLSLCTPGLAAPVQYDLVFTGDEEVPGPGDPTGSAQGTLTIDPTDGAYGTIAWNFIYSDLSGDSTLTGMHIHDGAVGVQAGVYFDMGTATTGGAGTLIQSLEESDWDTQTNWSQSGLQAIVDNPEGFYVNIHTTQYPSGAVRAQLPEPTSLALLGTGGMLLLLRRRVACCSHAAASR